MPTAVSTLVIDSNRLFREGLKRLLADTPYAIVAEAGDLSGALDVFHSGAKIDLAIADFDGEDDADADCIRLLRKSIGDVKIVVLTSRLSGTCLADSLNAGADGYLLKEISATALERSLGLVMVGEKVFPTYLAKLLVNGQFSAPQRQLGTGGSSSAALSDRETQILGCLVNGDPNKVIARQLHISEATVKVHLKNLLKKIRAANRTQAAVWAMNHRLIGSTTGTDPRRPLGSPAPEFPAPRPVSRSA
jgi:two-component system nitrate/nitrite response regulator NarL